MGAALSSMGSAVVNKTFLENELGPIGSLGTGSYSSYRDTFVEGMSASSFVDRTTASQTTELVI